MGLWPCGPSTSNPQCHDRDRLVTQMMEDERYQYCKQHDPDIIGSGASPTAPSSSEDGKANENDEDEDFDAALKKRRNDRKKKKTKQ